MFSALKTLDLDALPADVWAVVLVAQEQVTHLTARNADLTAQNADLKCSTADLTERNAALATQKAELEALNA
jgi:cell division protein FtsB